MYYVESIMAASAMVLASATRSQLSLGTGSRGCSPSAACEAAIVDALRLGWDTIDCAWEYGTSPL